MQEGQLSVNIEYYNTKRPHQGIEHQIPMTKYAKIAA